VGAVRRSRILRGLTGAAVLALGLSFGPCGGPRGLERYPPRETSPYVLPFEGTRWVCQGNNGFISHFEDDEFAYDFHMPEGTPVLAARGGVVRSTRADRNTIGTDQPANYVCVDHGDGTLGWYLHLVLDGVLVVRGQRVEQGDVIARSGWTGRALIPHLHFEVTRDAPGRVTVPVTFADAPGDGIPRAPRFVTPTPRGSRERRSF
jgi:murein DD-endopeptidase MepM/ murein hydrolase activator NlpD